MQGEVSSDAEMTTQTAQLSSRSVLRGAKLLRLLRLPIRFPVVRLVSLCVRFSLRHHHLTEATI